MINHFNLSINDVGMAKVVGPTPARMKQVLPGIEYLMTLQDSQVRPILADSSGGIVGALPGVVIAYQRSQCRGTRCDHLRLAKGEPAAPKSSGRPVFKSPVAHCAIGGPPKNRCVPFDLSRRILPAPRTWSRNTRPRRRRQTFPLRFIRICRAEPHLISSVSCGFSRFFSVVAFATTVPYIAGNSFARCQV
jgi:hypothetical protein